jgi:broad specificity phosphatase PhoE
MVRHGQTDWNVQKRYQGHSDLPLNETGEVQAHHIADRMAGEKLHAIVSSDLLRTMQTAQAVVAHHPKLTIQPEVNLREANFGVFEGLRYKDVIEQHKAMAEAWFADPECPPNSGEKLSQVLQRVQRIRMHIEDNYARKRVLLVGHDGALRLLISDLLGLPAMQYWRFNLDPCSLTQVNIYPGGAILVRLNDVCHLGAHDR